MAYSNRFAWAAMSSRRVLPPNIRDRADPIRLATGPQHPCLGAPPAQQAAHRRGDGLARNEAQACFRHGGTENGEVRERVRSVFLSLREKNKISTSQAAV